MAWESIRKLPLKKQKLKFRIWAISPTVADPLKLNRIGWGASLNCVCDLHASPQTFYGAQTWALAGPLTFSHSRIVLAVAFILVLY